MKSIFLILGLSTLFISRAQQLSLMIPTKESQPYHPIRSDMAYSAILNTNCSKDSLLQKTTNFFIEENLIKPSDLNTIEFNENLSEYRGRFIFKHGQFKSKGMLGAGFVAPPVILIFDAVFAFNNLGQIKVTFTNFDSQLYVFADEDNFINCYKGAGGNGKNLNAILDADKTINDESLVVLMSESLVTKALLLANGQVDMLNGVTRGEFRKKLEEQFDTYEKAVSSGSTSILSKKNILSYRAPGPQGKYWNEQVNKFFAENWVFGVDKYRWENYFEMHFNYFFKEITRLVSGDLSKIALDGNIIYEKVDDKILPTDPKERKIWLKKNISF